MYCMNCGKQINEDVRFCPYCGKSVKFVENVTIGSVTEKEDAKKCSEKETNIRKWVAGIAVVMLITVVLVCVIFLYTPVNRIQRQLDLGQKYLDSQQYAEACIAFEKAIAVDDMCIEAYVGGIEAYGHIEDTESLRLLYDRALNAVRKLDKNTMDENMIYVIEIYLAADVVYTDEPKKMIELFTEGLAVTEKNAEIVTKLSEQYIALAERYIRENDYGKSLEIYDKLLDLDRENEQIIAELKFILQKYLDILTAEERFDEIAELAEKYEPMEIGVDFQTENQAGQWMLAEETRHYSDVTRIEYEYEFMEAGIDFQAENEAGQWVISKETYSTNDDVFWIKYEYEYSATGYIQRVDYGTGLYYEGEFDENGNQTSSKGYDSNGIFQWYDYEYDENENLIKSELRWGSSEGGPGKIEYEYSGDLLIKEVAYGDINSSTVWFWSEYEYDADGNMVTEKHYYFDEYEMGWKEWGYKYEYAGNVVAKITYDSNGNESLEEKIEYEYDEAGNMIKETHVSPVHSGITSWTEYTYVYLEPRKGKYNR